MDKEVLLVERRGAVAELKLNNPTTLNSLVRPLRERLDKSFRELVADPQIRAIVLTGMGRGFCSGGDFSQPRESSHPVTTRRDIESAQSWMQILIRSETVLITAVNGPAAGAGFGLALLGDVVFASDKAFFKAGFPRIGVPPDYLLGWTLTRAVGRVRAFDLLTSDRRISPDEAEKIGMITRVVPHDRLMAEAFSAANTLASGPYSLGLTKRLVQEAHSSQLSAYMSSEAFSFAVAVTSDDHVEGREAFRRKESPVFRGS